MYMYDIYIYIYVYIERERYTYMQSRVEQTPAVRPISLVRLPLLRFVASKLSGEFLLDMGIPPLRIQILHESDPLKSRILVRRLAAEPAWSKTPAVVSEAYKLGRIKNNKYNNFGFGGIKRPF